MKIIFKTDELNKVLRDVTKVIPSSTNRPVLKHVLIRVNKDDERVEIYASSEDMSVRRTLVQLIMDPPVVIEESGACLIPGRELSEIVKKANQPHITLNGSGTVTGISFGKSKFELSSLAPEQFTPYENENSDTTTITVSAPELHRLLRRTSYATFKGDGRPLLTGVNLTVSDNQLSGIGTDALRLATYTTTCLTGAGDNRNITVPAAQLEKLLGALPAHDEDEEVTLVLGTSSLMVSWSDDEIRMVMRGLQGDYPDISRIIPNNPPHKVVVDRQVLLDACERVSILSQTEHQRATITFGPEGILLYSRSSQYGDAKDTIEDISTTLSDEVVVQCNINFWIAMLRSYEGAAQVEIRFGERIPVTINPAGGVGLSLIAPMLDPQPQVRKDEVI
jgi:DNA polymerase-3 subunit beta